MGRKSAKTVIGEGEIDPLLQPIRRAFSEDNEVSVGRVLSANGLMIKGKVFAAISKGRLLVKLPRDEVATLVAANQGAAFSTGGDRIMKEWVTIGVEQRDKWLDITRRARDFVSKQAAN